MYYSLLVLVIDKQGFVWGMNRERRKKEKDNRSIDRCGVDKGYNNDNNP